MLDFLKERRAQQHYVVEPDFINPATDVIPSPSSAPSFALGNTNLD